MCKNGGWGDINCLLVAKIGLKIYSYSTFLFRIMYVAVVCGSIDNTLTH